MTNSYVDLWPGRLVWVAITTSLRAMGLAMSSQTETEEQYQRSHYSTVNGDKRGLVPLGNQGQ